MKIKEYPKINSLEQNDTFVVETENGTKQIEFGDVEFKQKEITLDPAIAHRNTYRGKNLGTSFTDAQKAAIEDGSFEDLYIGDYWIDGTTQWIIMDINYPIYKQPASDAEDHPNSLTIVPRGILYKSKFDDTATKGYGVSYLRSTGLTQAKSMIHSFFGADKVFHFTETLTTETATTLPHASGYVQNNDCSVEILCLPMIFGRRTIGSNGSPNSSTGYDAGSSLPFNRWSSNLQLKGFALNPDLITTPSFDGEYGIYWIEESFSYGNYGTTILSYRRSDNKNKNFVVKDYGKTNQIGVRPVFHIHG